MDVTARLAQGAALGADDFADITSVPVTAIDFTEDGLRVTFDGDLTPAQQQRVRLRITSCDSTEEQMRVALAAYLTLDAPTAAQTLAATKRMIRLVLSLKE